MQPPPKHGKDQQGGPPASLLLMSPSSGLTFNMSGTPGAVSGPSLLMPVPLSPTGVDDLDGVGESDSFLNQSPPRSTHLNHSMPPVQMFNPAAMPGGASIGPPTMFSVQSSSSAFAPPLPPEPLMAGQTSSGPISRRYVLAPQVSGASPSPSPSMYNPPVAQVNPMPAVCTPVTSPTGFPPPGESSNSPVDLLPQHASQQGGGMPPVTVYHPVEAHWFYAGSPSTAAEPSNGQHSSAVIWKAYSRHDSYQLEEAWKRQLAVGSSAPPPHEEPVATEGGRYDVYVGQRRRCSVFWEETPVEIRRASWFYRPENEARYLPYSEELCEELEREYHRIVTTGGWHRQFELFSQERSNARETFVFHSPQSMIHIRNYASPENKFPGLVEAEVGHRPRVVRRGLDDFLDQLEDGEWQPVDHVVFVVHGIGSVCDMRFRSLVECVDDLRRTSNQLTKSHFRPHVGRIEFLPVHWHGALRSEASGIDKLLQTITLRSIPKLRQYTNNNLIDILFYTSPKYCQEILDTVAMEMSRLKNLYLGRRPDYRGVFSVAGHSLGSVICFDLLSHQGEPSQMRQETVDHSATNGRHDNQSGASTPRSTNRKSLSPLKSEPDEGPSDIEDLLQRLGLTSTVKDILDREQIDMESLLLLSEEDLVQLNLPMGPRKKLAGYLAEQRATPDSPMSRSSPEPLEQQAGVVLDPLLQRCTSQQVDYVVGTSGTGQPFITYPQLDFPVMNLFALGSPIALFLATRGVAGLGDDYRLPGCRGFFNIFHPFDPVAYRVETMINDRLECRPVLIPHHKGRKRMHLELKENLARMGSDIKSRIVTSIRSTWQTIHDFALAHQTTEEEQQAAAMNEQEVDQVLTRMAHERDDMSSNMTEEEVQIGQLNQGRRIDYVLQEAPLESFNDYIFALSSHTCYWTSEDTALLLLKEIYVPLGVHMTMPGGDFTPGRSTTVQQPPPPPAPPLNSMIGQVGMAPPEGYAPFPNMPPPTPPSAALDRLVMRAPPPNTPTGSMPPPPPQNLHNQPQQSHIAPPTALYYPPTPPTFNPGVNTPPPSSATPPKSSGGITRPSRVSNPAPPPPSSSTVLGANALKPQKSKLFNKTRKN